MTSTLIELTGTDMQPLSVELRAHTAQAHEDAEHSTFMSDLLGGKLDIGAFIRLQEQSWLFYSALEEAVRACSTDERARELLDRRLERRETLEKDLDLLHSSPNWQEHVQPTPATAEYISRLDEIGAQASFPRVLAHHYVRYLGDLSGGQVIARMMSREYGVEESALSFYRFDGIGKLKPYKDRYRLALDSLELSDSERAVLLDEAAQAFTLNKGVFEALA